MNVKNVIRILKPDFFYTFLGPAMINVWKAKSQNICFWKILWRAVFSLWSQILEELHSKYIFFPNWTIDGTHHWSDQNWLDRHEIGFLRTHKTSYIKTYCRFCNIFTKNKIEGTPILKLAMVKRQISLTNIFSFF